MYAAAMFPPERIVCLTEETVETLYLLGEERRIVGVSGYAVRPPQVSRIELGGEHSKEATHVLQPLWCSHSWSSAVLPEMRQCGSRRRSVGRSAKRSRRSIDG